MVINTLRFIIYLAVVRRRFSNYRVVGGAILDKVQDTRRTGIKEKSNPKGNNLFEVCSTI